MCVQQFTTAPTTTHELRAFQPFYFGVRPSQPWRIVTAIIAP